MIIALDIATTTGVAIGEIGGQPRWAVRAFASDGGTGQVVSMFRAWLGEICTRFRPRMIIFESPYVPHPGERRAMNVATLRRLIALVETAASVAFERNVGCFEATSGNAAKFMTGKGRWPGGSDEKKARVIAACLRMGWDVEGEHDAADALALWCLAEDQIAPQLAGRRRREAADRERLTAGEGPLFPIPEMTNAPRRPPRSAQKNPSDEDASNGHRNLFTVASGEIQSAKRNSARKIA